eukprot:4740984-Pyramimonas_sp.AAC.1
MRLFTPSTSCVSALQCNARKRMHVYSVVGHVPVPEASRISAPKSICNFVAAGPVADLPTSRIRSAQTRRRSSHTSKGPL